MYYGTIKKHDIANGEGIRTTLFVSGCRNRCPGCFQPETWAFDYGKPFDDEAKNMIFDSLSTINDYICKLALQGVALTGRQN